jgi:F-type H+-transporting ATPase subunit delta
VADPNPTEPGLAGRYATALFQLARDAKAIDAVADGLAQVEAALATSADFASLTANPLVSRAAATRAVNGVAATLGLHPLAANMLGVLAANRRLGALKPVIASYRRLVSAWKGEATAQVTTARALDADQMDALKKKLRAGLGREVSIEARVDPAILGGLVVKVGSKLIDNSLKSKLDSLSLAMKG